MEAITYFKLQAKNLFRDYKTQYVSEVYEDGGELYDYKPRYFDVNGIVVDFDLDEENFTLMKAQHVIAYMVGFNKWTDLLKASKPKLELAKLLFENQDKVYLVDWEDYIDSIEDNSGETLTPESELEIFKQVALNWEASNNPFPDYRFNKGKG